MNKKSFYRRYGRLGNFGIRIFSRSSLRGKIEHAKINKWGISLYTHLVNIQGKYPLQGNTIYYFPGGTFDL